MLWRKDAINRVFTEAYEAHSIVEPQLYNPTRSPTLQNRDRICYSEYLFISYILQQNSHFIDSFHTKQCDIPILNFGRSND